MSNMTENQCHWYSTKEGCLGDYAFAEPTSHVLKKVLSQSLDALDFSFSGVLVIGE